MQKRVHKRSFDNLHQLFPGQRQVIAGAEDITGQSAGAIRDERIVETCASDESTHVVRSDELKDHIGGGVVAAGDHRLESSSFRNDALRFGGLKVGLPNDQTLESSARGLASRRSSAVRSSLCIILKRETNYSASTIRRYSDRLVRENLIPT